MTSLRLLTPGVEPIWSSRGRPNLGVLVSEGLNMGTSLSFPDMATLDRHYRRLFLHALSRLARQGFVAQPADIEDLIQDFYANCYRGLKERYDPAVGTLENYLYSAFLRYARQRIIRSRRWN